MVRHDVGARGERAMQGRDVGVTDHRLRRACDGVVVERVENAHGAVAASHTPDGIDVIARERQVQVCGTLCVVAGEVSGSQQHVRTDNGFPTKRPHVVTRLFEIRFIAKRTGRGDERNTRPLAEEGRSPRPERSWLFVTHITLWHMRCHTGVGL